MVACLSLGLFACSSEQSEPVAQGQQQAGGVLFDMEVGYEPLGGDGSELRALCYDANNLNLNKYPRLSLDNTCSTHTFIFEGRRLIGYTELDWKVSQAPETGALMLKCKKILPVYSMTESNGIATLDKSQTITLAKGKTYKILGMMGDGVLELGMPDQPYLNRGTYGPRLSFDSRRYAEMYEGGKFKSGEGCVPYVFHRDVTITTADEVQVLSSANPKLRITPAAPVLRFIIRNNTHRALTSDDVYVRFQGITPDFVLGAMSGPAAPGHRIFRGVTPEGENEPRDFELPIEDLAPGAVGEYYLPVVMTNGDPANINEIELSIPSVLTTDSANGYTYRARATGDPHFRNPHYSERDKGKFSLYWINSEGRYNMHTIDVSIVTTQALPDK